MDSAQVKSRTQSQAKSGFGYTTRAGARVYTAPKEIQPVQYLYPSVLKGERVVWKKSEKKSQLRRAFKLYGPKYEKEYGTVYERKHQFTPRDEMNKTETTNQKRRRISIENIVDLFFGSLADKGFTQWQSVREDAVLNKKAVEHRNAIIRTVIISAVLIAVFALIYNFLFSIHEIVPDESQYYSAEQIAEASGVQTGDKLYSFRADTVEERITFSLPYIKSAELTRGIPDKVYISLAEDTGVYFANIFGDKVVLSQGLRVLGEYDETRDTGLIELLLPEVNYAVAGRVIRFADDSNDRYIRSSLSTLVESEMYENCNMLDLRNPYSLAAYYKDIYYVKIGSTSDLALKMRMAARTVASLSSDSLYPAIMDVTTPEEASLRQDATVSYKSK